MFRIAIFLSLLGITSAGTLRGQNCLLIPSDGPLPPQDFFFSELAREVYNEPLKNGNMYEYLYMTGSSIAVTYIFTVDSSGLFNYQVYYGGERIIDTAGVWLSITEKEYEHALFDWRSNWSLFCPKYTLSLGMIETLYVKSGEGYVLVKSLNGGIFEPLELYRDFFEPILLIREFLAQL